MNSVFNRFPEIIVGFRQNVGEVFFDYDFSAAYIEEVKILKRECYIFCFLDVISFVFLLKILYLNHMA